MAAARSDDGRDVGLGLVAGQEARRGQQQRFGRVDRARNSPRRTSQRDVATVEPLQWQAELESGCEQGQVVVGGQGHVGWRPSGGAAHGRADRVRRYASRVATRSSGTMKTSLPTGPFAPRHGAVVHIAGARLHPEGAPEAQPLAPRRPAPGRGAGRRRVRGRPGAHRPGRRGRQPGARSRRGRGQPAARATPPERSPRRTPGPSPSPDRRPTATAADDPVPTPTPAPDATGRRGRSPATSGRCRTAG